MVALQWTIWNISWFLLIFTLFQWAITLQEYTVNAVIFAGLLFRVWQHKKHIRGLLNSRWADAHLSFLYCTKLTSCNEWYIYKYVCNWAAQKQSRSQTESSILPICINTHGQYTTPTCPKCAYKISQIFSRVFEFALAEICAKFTKINVPWIFPLLQ